MIEKLYNVQPVWVRYNCDSCGIGEMKPKTGGIVQYTDPLRIEHRCTRYYETEGKCKDIFLTKSYPYVDFILNETP